MSILFAVSSYHEHLPSPNSFRGCEKINDYVGAIEGFSGADLTGGRFKNITIVVKDFTIHLHALQHPWLKSDDMYAILHDSPYDLETTDFYQERMKVFVHLMAYIAKPKDEQGRISNYTTTRTDRPSHFNRVHHWETDVDLIIKWIEKHDGEIFNWKELEDALVDLQPAT